MRLPETTMGQLRYIRHREKEIRLMAVADILLEYGVNASPQDDDGSTPLHLALSKGHVNLAEFLLDHSADPTTQAEEG